MRTTLNLSAEALARVRQLAQQTCHLLDVNFLPSAVILVE